VASENPEMQSIVEEREAPLARPAKRPKVDRPGRWVRIVLVAIGGLLAVIFAIAIYLNPYQADGTPRTMATHTGLGLPPCNFVFMTGKPCPSCGMTTSFSLLVRGDVGNSLKANWVGTTLAVTWAALLVWCLASAIAGKLFFIPPNRGELVLTFAVGGFLVLMLGRWVAVLLE
jgi:hypothetical protein